MAEDKTSDRNDGGNDFENEPSTLDEMTHAEMRLLYEESTKTIRFIKNLQWSTAGSTLLVFGAFVIIAALTEADKAFASKLTALTILLTISVIFSLIMYQFWQYNEAQKINELAKFFSSAFRRVRNVKSTRESNVHRYILLLFMVVLVMLGAVVAYLGLQQVLTHRI